MQFSLALTPYKRFPDHHQMMKTVSLAEKLGFFSINFGDHVAVAAQEKGTVSFYYHDQLVLGATITAKYPSLSVYFNIVVLPYHHPVPLAKALATLDLLSEGRLIVGIGIGWLRSEFDAMGIHFEERGAITNEYLGAMQALWRDGAASFRGKYVSFQDIISEPKPFRKPQPVLWIGVGATDHGIHRAIRLHADGVTMTGRPPEKLRRDTALLRELLEGSARDPSLFSMAYSLDYGQHSAHMQSHLMRSTGHLHDVLSSDPAAALGQIENYEKLGLSHLAMRFTAEHYQEFEEQMIEFSENILKRSTRSQAI